MRKYYKWIFIYVVLNLFINTSNAACKRNNVPTITGTTDMGRIVVNPNLKVGDVIATQTFLIRGTSANTAIIDCKAGDILHADVVMGNLVNGNNGIYQTNIPGVGIRFNRNGSDYPFTFKVSSTGTMYLSDSNITVTLIKTAEVVGSGPLSPGRYTEYGYRPLKNPSLATYISSFGTIIVSPSCSILSGNEQNIKMKTITVSELPTKGQTAGDTPFSISLKCNGGALVNSSFEKIKMTFSGIFPSGMSANDGVLDNLNTTSAGAKGIGIQILENSTTRPIRFNQPYTIGSLSGPEDEYVISENFIARYYRYGNQVSSGEVLSKMIYNITYD